MSGLAIDTFTFVVLSSNKLGDGAAKLYQTMVITDINEWALTADVALCGSGEYAQHQECVRALPCGGHSE